MVSLNLVSVEDSPTQPAKKTFLREISLSQFRQRQDGVVADSGVASKGGFWSKVSQKSQTRDSSMTRVSSIQLDIGGWINLPPGYQQSVSLLIVFQDRVGEHTVVVDQMNARGATQILLAGSADIQAHGKIRKMAVYCGGIEDDTVWIDDMHIKSNELSTDYISVAS